MGIKSTIVDHFNNKPTTVVECEENVNKLAVATTPLKRFLNKTLMFTNPIYGNALNIDASIIGEDTIIYAGNEVQWTPTAISGIWDFTSTTYVYTNTYSIDATDTINGDIAQLYSGGLFVVNDDVISGAIYITTWNQQQEKHVEIYGYNTETGQIVGNVINIDSYISTTTLNQWQTFNIPTFEALDILGKEIDSIRIRTVNLGGAPPNYHIDDINLLATTGAGPLRYEIRPNINTWLHVQTLSITMVSEYIPIMENATIPNIPYNGLIGVPLINGIEYQRTLEGEIELTYNLKNMIEFIAMPNCHISSSGYDGNFTWVKIDYPLGEPFILKDEFDDFIRFTLFDDLSSLQMFRITAQAYEERRFDNFKNKEVQKRC